MTQLKDLATEIARESRHQKRYISIRLRTLVLLRWIAVLGQTVTILYTRFGLGYEFNMVPALNTVLGLAVFNYVVIHIMPPRLNDTQGMTHLGFDLLQLGLLLYLTGGLINPFVILMLVPVTISAATLSLRSTTILLGLAYVQMLILYFYHKPLPWTEAGLDIPLVYQYGSIAALIIALGFVTLYSFRIAFESRQRAQALTETEQQISKSKKMSALGGLAAAAAHELGTPLNTLAIITRDLKRDVKRKAVQKDLDLMISQIERCKGILAQFARQPMINQVMVNDYLPLPVLLDEVANEYKKLYPKNQFEVMTKFKFGTDDLTAINVYRTPELVSALRNLMHNAFRFAEKKVMAQIASDPNHIILFIEDDGPGFSSNVLSRLGEPYVHQQDGGKKGNMGLGVFIAKTLLEDLGGKVSFENGEKGGALVTIRLPKKAKEIFRNL